MPRVRKANLIDELEKDRRKAKTLRILAGAGYYWIQSEQYGDETGFYRETDEAFMTGEPDSTGVNLCLWSSFFNRVDWAEHPSPTEFITAFEHTFNRLWADYMEDDACQ